VKTDQTAIVDASERSAHRTRRAETEQTQQLRTISLSHTHLRAGQTQADRADGCGAGALRFQTADRSSREKAEEAAVRLLLLAAPVHSTALRSDYDSHTQQVAAISSDGKQGNELRAEASELVPERTQLAGQFAHLHSFPLCAV
jgi:hypothetical protein